MPARLVLPRPGGPGEEQVVGGLAPAPGRLEDDREVLLQLGLADELVEPAGPQPDLVGRPRTSSAGSSGSSSSSRIGAASAPGRGELAQRLA